MTRIEEEHVTTTTTTTDEEPVKPHVDNINVNTGGGETITVNHPDEPTTTRTETTHTEVHESD